MKKGKSIWKRILLPFLCALVVLVAAGCGSGRGRAAAGGTQDAAPASGIEEAGPSESSPDPSQVDGEEGSDGGQASGGGSGHIDENGIYTTAEDVSLYLHTYGRLPLNFMTKKEARSRGWSGGSLEEYAPGMCIGGDRFGNYEGVLPEGNYHECDINTLGADRRGAERLVYADDGRIYYTNDHYETFTLLYGKE